MNKNNKQEGQLLLEIILTVAAAAMIVSLGAQLVYTSLYSNKSANEKSAAISLAEEELDGARNASAEEWQDLFGLTKGTAQYHVATSTDKWAIFSNLETIKIDGKNYDRYFSVQNICRDGSSRNITGITDTNGTSQTCAGNGGNHDPSTQKITVTVSATGTEPLVLNDYITRWHNKVCEQTDWGGGTSAATSTCPSNKYGADDGNIDTAGGELKLK